MKNQEKETFSREKKFIQFEPKMNYILKLSDKDFKASLITILKKTQRKT